MGKIIALKVKETDNVATVFSEDAAPGAMVTVQEPDGKVTQIQVWGRSSIPYGHKVALRPVCRGGDIVKYGEVIGRASADIQAGDHVHIHNMESLRGRGDLETR